MKVLFVCSGNSDNNNISPIVKAQAESLVYAGNEIHFFCIKGKGLLGYIRNVIPLTKEIKKKSYNVLHAHYLLCGIVAALAVMFTKLKLIVSLMGSDVNRSFFWRNIAVTYTRLFWDATIVKSEEMKSNLGINIVEVIPNGVNLELFDEIDRYNCKDKLGLLKEKKYILFAANPEQRVKNFSLAKEACSQLTTHNSQLITLGKTPHEEIPLYINTCNVLILTSLWEGSPNIIKEAMACNCPIVSTDVGDVRWLLGNLEGHYIAKHEPEDFAKKIKLALEYGKRTKGRDRIIELGLDSETVAKRIVEVYERVLETKRLRD